MDNTSSLSSLSSSLMGEGEEVIWRGWWMRGGEARESSPSSSVLGKSSIIPSLSPSAQ